MACASQSMLSANGCSFSSQSQRILSKPPWPKWKKASILSVNASSSSKESADCNVEDCAPDKEVGKVSMEWVAGDRTKIVGTFPPRKRGWTGYVEKDTAGQTNIYSIEPAVYIAESAISSGNAGASSEGTESIATFAAGLALFSLVAASAVLFQVNKNEPQIQKVDYYGPPLSYYINKFQPDLTVEAYASPVPESSPSAQASSTIESSVASEYKFFSKLLLEDDAKVIPEVQVQPEVTGNS